jgi:phosphoglucosamine mutase
MINVKISKGFDWEGYGPLVEAQRSVAADLGDSGRILIRPSGTEPLLRVMVEAQSESAASTAAKRLVASLKGAPA